MIAMLLFGGQLIAQEALGEVLGEIVDKKSGFPLVDAHVYIDDNGRRYQAKTDLDGRFRISAVPSGVYRLNIRYQEDTLKGIRVEVPLDGFFNTGLISFTSNIQEHDAVVFKYRDQVRLIDGNLPTTSLTSKEIDKSPLKFDVKGLVASMSSEVRMTEDGELFFRGARKGDMIYLVDGVKTVNLSSVPGVSIGKMMVYTGGLPAKYGDTLGGVVVIESKSYFDLFRAWQASN